MKKKIALLLAAVMTVGSLPMTAFASTTNTVSAIKTVEDGNTFNASVFLDEFKGIGTTPKLQTVKLTLTNAKFDDATFTTGGGSTTEDPTITALKNAYLAAKQELATAEENLQTAIDNDADVTAAQTALTAAQTALEEAKESLGIDKLEEALTKAEADYDKSYARGVELLGTKDQTTPALNDMGDLALNAISDVDGTTPGKYSGLVGETAKAEDEAEADLKKALFKDTSSSDELSGSLFDAYDALYKAVNTNASGKLAEVKIGSTDLNTLGADGKSSGNLFDVVSGLAADKEFTCDTTKLGLDETADAAKIKAITDALDAANKELETFKMRNEALNTAKAEASKIAAEATQLLTDIGSKSSGQIQAALNAKDALDTASRDLANYEKAVTDKQTALDMAIAGSTAVKEANNKVVVAQDAFDKAEQALIDAGIDPDTVVAGETTASTREVVSNGNLTPGVVDGKVQYTKISDTQVMAEFWAVDGCSPIELPFVAEADGSGDALVAVETVDSVVSSSSLKIANIADGATTTTISGTTSIKEKGSKIKNVVITETTAGSIEAGEMKLRLTNGFKFTKTPKASDIVVFPNDGNLTIGTPYLSNDDQDLMIPITGSSKTASTISVGNLYIGYDEDDVEVGDECEITVSDAGTTKQSIVVGKASDYTVSFTAEDKDLPTFYAGTYSEDTDSLVVTLKEELEDAWITGRSTKIVFPEGVEVVEVNVEDKGNTKNADDTDNGSTTDVISIDENEVDLSNVEVNDDKKAELELSFKLSISPEFTGDIEATLTGSGIGDDQTVVVGTAAAPVKVEADINELPIDYRKTEASDIVITEADAGVLKKDKTVRLAIDGIAFDGDPTVEVESGDMKIENVKVDGEYLTFKIKTESQKEAAVIRISDVNLNMNRSLPAGDYDLMFVAYNDKTDGDVNAETDLSTNAIIRNYNDDSKAEQGTFDVDEITALKGYVTVVTAGRDQDDSTFTTKVSVTIGASTMKAGTKDITLDVPAYISNGYTMMPVRAVTEALSGSAIVRWDDPTKTVTITFGQRVISMTVGSNVMKINGVDVAMQAQCEITDSRAFIPLRDLGYALGLNDSKIAWDDATKTATLN